MKVVQVYWRLYADCIRKAFAGIGKNLWTLLLPMGLIAAMALLSPLLVGLGFVGGILLALALDAAISCYLYFTGEVVAHSKVSLSEFKRSIGAYFWSVMNLFFVIWIVRFLLDMLVRGNPKRWIIDLAVTLLIAIMLNPAPEVIYQRGTRNGLETIQRSARFIQENWIEWFIPNLLILGGAWFLAQQVQLVLGGLGILLVSLVSGAFIHLLMVFRGHLFQALDGSSHRQRMFRFRNSQSP